MALKIDSCSFDNFLFILGFFRSKFNKSHCCEVHVSLDEPFSGILDEAILQNNLQNLSSKFRRSPDCIIILQLLRIAFIGEVIPFDIPSVVSEFDVRVCVCSFFIDKICINRFPYNWRTPTGYAISICIQTVIMIIGIEISSYILCFFVSCCLYSVACAKDVQEHLSDLSAYIRAIQIRWTMVQRSQTRQKLCNIIEFHGLDSKFYSIF